LLLSLQSSFIIRPLAMRYGSASTASMSAASALTQSTTFLNIWHSTSKRFLHPVFPCGLARFRHLGPVHSDGGSGQISKRVCRKIIVQPTSDGRCTVHPRWSRKLSSWRETLPRKTQIASITKFVDTLTSPCLKRLENRFGPETKKLTGYSSSAVRVANRL
jgi:hypothetical protein